MSKRPSVSRLLAVLGAAVVLTACVKPAEPGVAVKTLQADIVFGVQPPAAAAPPSVEPTIIEIEEDAPLPAGPTPAPRRPAPRQNLAPCMDAQETAFPEVAAGTDVTNQPAAGQYRWKVGGNTTVGGIQVPRGGFTNRRIENVSSVTTSTNTLSDPPNESVTRTFTYDLVDDAPGNGKAVQTFEVKSNPNVATVTSPVGKAIQVGEPARGVSLAKVTLLDGTGKAVGAFTPTPAITLLPLQVFSGSDFTSVGVDPATGATLVHQAQVTKRVPIDACGEMVDGWQVTAQQVYTDPSGQSRASSYTYTIATQLGGMVIYEKIGPPANAPTAVSSDTLELTLGQLEPTTP